MATAKELAAEAFARLGRGDGSWAAPVILAIEALVAEAEVDRKASAVLAHGCNLHLKSTDALAKRIAALEERANPEPDEIPPRLGTCKAHVGHAPHIVSETCNDWRSLHGFGPGAMEQAAEEASLVEPTPAPTPSACREDCVGTCGFYLGKGVWVHTRAVHEQYGHDHEWVCNGSMHQPTMPSTDREPSMCDDACWGTCRFHDDRHSRASRRFRGCDAFRCDGTGPAHRPAAAATAEPERTDTPSVPPSGSVAPAVPTTGRLVAVGTCYSHPTWGDHEHEAGCINWCWSVRYGMSAAPPAPVFALTEWEREHVRIGLAAGKGSLVGTLARIAVRALAALGVPLDGEGSR